jgi:hypothetical protein
LNGRDRILAAFHGRAADAVPFAPNLYYWFYGHRAAGTLPEELSGATHPIDALRALGADILARWDTHHATREVFPAGTLSDEFTGHSALERPLVTSFNTYPPGRTQRRRQLRTPHGTLTSTWTMTPEAGTDFESEFWWKDWADYPAIRDFFEMRDYAFDRALFGHWVERVGEDGAVMACVTQTPLKTFHWLAGAERASLFIADHPAEMRELAAIHQRKALALLASMVDDPLTEIFVSLENLDSDFYSPKLYRDYCDEFLRAAAALIHSRGKLLVVHACGRNRVLMPLVGASGVDCLEGLTPPPMGNVPLHEARHMSGRETFVVNGGIGAAEVELNETQAHAYTRDLFARMGDRRRFIFASSCTTPLSARWATLCHYRDAAREFGIF